MQVELQTITPYPPLGMCCVVLIEGALKDVLMDVLMCCIKTTNKKLTDNMKVLYKNNK